MYPSSKLNVDASVENSLGDEIKLLKNGVEVGTALGTQQLSNEICIEDTSDGDNFEFRNGGKDNVSKSGSIPILILRTSTCVQVYIKEIFQNGVLKNFAPIWIDLGGFSN